MSANTSSAVIQRYKNKVYKRVVADLDKELAYEMVKGNPTLFSLEPQQPQYIPKDEGAKGGLEAILSKYTKTEE